MLKENVDKWSRKRDVCNSGSLSYFHSPGATKVEEEENQCEEFLDWMSFVSIQL